MDSSTYIQCVRLYVLCVLYVCSVHVGNEVCWRGGRREERESEVCGGEEGGGRRDSEVCGAEEGGGRREREVCDGEEGGDRE